MQALHRICYFQRVIVDPRRIHVAALLEGVSSDHGEKRPDLLPNRNEKPDEVAIAAHVQAGCEWHVLPLSFPELRPGAAIFFLS
jgi:hypothetical protein